MSDVVPRAQRTKITPGDQEMGRALGTLKALLMRGQVNFAEIEARTHEITMVDILAGFALDPSLDVEFRRRCANNVLDRARGKVKAAVSLEVPDLSVPSEPDCFGAQLAEAQRAADEMQEFQRWLAKPIETWPADVRLKFRDQLGPLEVG